MEDVIGRLLNEVGKGKAVAKGLSLLQQHPKVQVPLGLPRSKYKTARVAR